MQTSLQYSSMKELPINIQEELKKCKSVEDLIGPQGLFKKILKDFVETALDEEMNLHLGYAKHDPKGKNTGNSRNGKTGKTVKSETFGEIEIHSPRDRNGEFTPQILKKRQTSLGKLEDQIISMYGRGMTTREIQAHVEEIYGAEISPTHVSHITDRIIDLVTEWQSRPLARIYPIVFFDAIHYKVRDNNKVVTKAAYTCLAIDKDGKKDVLGLWIGESEGAAYWLGVLHELKNRGVEDIFIACVDGLKGFPEAIQSVFPATEVQLCIVHQIRNSLRYVSWKDYKPLLSDLKLVYKATTQTKAELELENFAAKWGEKYPLVLKSWRNNWGNLSTYFRYPPEIRKVIYTTNAVEQLHRQFRKVTKNRAVFPNDNSLLKLLFLSVRNIAKKWTMSVQNWNFALTQFSIMFEQRLDLNP
jgi:putative transposase